VVTQATLSVCCAREGLGKLRDSQKNIKKTKLQEFIKEILFIHKKLLPILFPECT
jgi:hypothetical protein